MINAVKARGMQGVDDLERHAQGGAETQRTACGNPGRRGRSIAQFRDVNQRLVVIAEVVQGWEVDLMNPLRGRGPLLELPANRRFVRLGNDEAERYLPSRLSLSCAR
jgi:hypothetical protein